MYLFFAASAASSSAVHSEQLCNPYHHRKPAHTASVFFGRRPLLGVSYIEDEAVLTCVTQPVQQSPAMPASQMSSDVAVGLLGGWAVDGSHDGGTASHQGSGGSPHGHGATSEGSGELVRSITVPQHNPRRMATCADL